MRLNYFVWSKAITSVFQGSTWRFSGTLYEPDGITPHNWTGWTGMFQIRRSFKSTAALISLTNGAVGTAFNLGGALGTDGTVNILVTNAQTLLLPPEECVYELKVTEVSTGDVSTLSIGSFFVGAGVVR